MMDRGHRIGQGVALGRGVLVDTDLKAERVIAIESKPASVDRLAYYIDLNSALQLQPKIIQFRNWLIDEAKTASVNLYL